ncbi:MAG: hypothetical protein KBD83_07370 [Gammaproteobacteria bacterium]|nr:hypothetical protein [Gammaproteobacteria bacterium]
MKCLKCLLPIEDPAQDHYGLHSDCFASWFHVDKNTEFMGLQNISTSSSSGRDFTPQNDSFCSALMKDAVKKLIEKRFQELKNALST